MPQLDSLTFLIQIGSVFWYSWRLLVAITGKNFPQFIILPLGRKFCWVSIKSIVFVYKFSAILSLLMQFYFTLKISKLILICLDGFDFLSRNTVFVERFIRRRLHGFIMIVLNLNINLSQKKITAEENYGNKFNFLVLQTNNSKFLFEKYTHLDVYYNIKKYPVILKQVLKFRFHEDESILNLKY